MLNQLTIALDTTYILVNLDSGKKLRKSRHEFQLPEVAILDEDFTQEINETSEEKVRIQKRAVKKRFLDITEEDVQILKLISNSKRTRANDMGSSHF